MAKAKMKQLVDQNVPQIENAGLVEYLDHTPHQAIAIGECRMRKVIKETGRGKEEVEEVYVSTIDDENPGEVVYRSGWLFRLKCKACGKPKCTRIVYKLDELNELGNDKMLFSKACKEIDNSEFTDVEDIKGQLEV